MNKKDSLKYLYSLELLKPLNDASAALRFTINNLIHKSLDWAEFGVYKGGTARFLFKKLPIHNSLYLFDSFKGLPESWKFSDNRVYKNHKKGYFLIPEKDIPLYDNDRIKLKIGWFNETIPQFIKQHSQPLGLIHIDCDIYISTKHIFDHLNSLIIPGTLIVFDEYYNYDIESNGWMEHEYKAFQEFIKNKKREYEYVARSNLEQVVVKIIK